MNKIGQEIEDLIKSITKETLDKRIVPDVPGDIIQTDSLGEVIEKLVILHIRMWMIEDQLGLAKTDEEIASLKKKTDVCFKIKRPKLVEAINRMVDVCIKTQSSMEEPSVKLYKGVTKNA
jgi:hypothetical protein